MHRSKRIQDQSFEKKRQHGTPAKATGLTDHTQTVKELLFGIPVLSVSENNQLFNG